MTYDRSFHGQAGQAQTGRAASQCCQTPADPSELLAEVARLREQVSSSEADNAHLRDQVEHYKRRLDELHFCKRVMQRVLESL